MPDDDLSKSLAEIIAQAARRSRQDAATRNVMPPEPKLPDVMNVQDPVRLAEIDKLMALASEAASRPGPEEEPESEREPAHVRHFRPMRWLVFAGTVAVIGVVMYRWHADDVGPGFAGSTRPPIPLPAGMPARMPAPAALPIQLQTPTPTPTPTSSVTGEHVGVLVQRDDDTSLWFANELTLNAGPGVDPAIGVVHTDGWLASLQALAVQPRVALVRYDALQAARQAPFVGRVPPLQVLAPVAVERIYFVVRADSALNRLRDIRHRAINVGPSGGDRALTARRVYHQMFGTWPPGSPSALLDERDALHSLLYDHQLEVVAVIGSSPRSSLRAFAPLAVHGLKLLAFDDTDPVEHKLVAAYLPVAVTDPRLVPGGGEVETIGVLSFLVRGLPATSGAPAGDGAISRFADDFCRRRSAIERDADGAWQGVSPMLRADVGWPFWDGAGSAFARCAN